MFKGSFSLFLILASIFKHNMNKKRDEFSFLLFLLALFFSIIILHILHYDFSLVFLIIYPYIHQF